jgi:hypothetical protein
MRMSKAIFVCVCLVGLTQPLWSQNKILGAPQEKGIPGYLDPRTGTFTTRIQHSGASAEVKPDVVSSTTVLFREQFNITITNDDQSSSAIASCGASIDTEDSLGFYEDDATIVATKTSSGWTCDIPVLVSWTLSSAGSDQIGACVHVDVFVPVTVGSISEAVDARESTPPCLTLPVPANAATVINAISITL